MIQLARYVQMTRPGMRRPESLNIYTVEVSPSAWKQMAHLPLETYQRIREALDDIAARMRPPTPVPLPRKGPTAVIPRSISLEGYTAFYDVDVERKRVMLRGIERDLKRGP